MTDPIVHGVDHSAFVEAGAGTGKTTRLVARVLRTIADAENPARVPLSRLAAITFTEKAAGEMKDRLRAKLERGEGLDPNAARQALEELDHASVQTIHAFAARLLREFPFEAGVPPGFAVLDDAQAKLAYDAWWDRTLGELLADSSLEQAWVIAGAHGVSRHQIATLGQAIHQNAWRLVDTSLRCPIPPGETLAALLADLRPEEGKYPCKLRDAMQAALDALAGHETMSPQALARALRGLPTRTNLGQKGSWPDVAAARARLQRVVGFCKQHAVLAVSELAEAIRARAVDECKRRRKEGALTFDDLLVLAARAVQQDRKVCRVAQARFRRVFVDEFQDTDPAQVDLVRAIVERAPAFYVGDPKQSIYRFRGADVDLYLGVRRDYEPHLHQLSINYRSRKEILSWVNTVFGRMFGAQRGQVPFVPLERSDRTLEGGQVERLLGPLPKDTNPNCREAFEVVAAIRQAVREGWPVRDGEAERAMRWSDVAVLLPTRTTLRFLEAAFLDLGVPYRIESQALAFESQEAIDLLNVLRAIEDPSDARAVVSALRSPAYAISDRELAEYRRLGGYWERPGPPHPVSDALSDLAARHQNRLGRPVAEVVEEVVRQTELLESGQATERPRAAWSRVRRVMDEARRYDRERQGTLRGFLRHIDGLRLNEARDHESVVPEADDDSVRVMTIHASKGLEFPLVAISGMASPSRASSCCLVVTPDGEFGLRLGGSSKTICEYGNTGLFDQEKELDALERSRLLYVAATRARDHLIISRAHTENRACDGKSLYERDEPDVEPWQPATADATPVGRAPVFDPVDEPAWLAFRDKALAQPVGTPCIAATAIAHLSDDPEPSFGRAGRGSTSFGRAVHATLQVADLADVDAVARQQAMAEGLPDQAEQVAEFARRALHSACTQAPGAQRYREVFLSGWVDGVLIEGFVDLLLDLGDGRYRVIDYKTDRVRDDHAIAQAMTRYERQAAAYALVLEQTLGARHVEAAFVFLVRDPATEVWVRDLPAVAAQVRADLAKLRGNG